MERFADRPLGRFLDDIASASPVPGGGAAAAISAAMAAGLLAMAARASTDSWADAAGIAAQAKALRDRVVPLAEESAAAYAGVLDLLAGPPADARKRRNFRLGTALARAADAPLRIAEAASDVAELGALVAERGSQQHRADATAAVLLAEGAVRVGAHLVRINLGAQGEDERVARADKLVEEAAGAARRALG